MPSTAQKKGNKSGVRDRRSDSRHSTPVSSLTDTSPPPTPVGMVTPSTTAAMPRETAYLKTPTAAIISQDPSIETLIDGTAGSKPGDPPSSRDLHALHDKIRDSVNKFMGKRSEVCDRSLRALMQKRKQRIQEEQQAELDKIKKEEEDVERKRHKKLHKKRSHDEMELDNKDEKKANLPSVGAHGLARQDGVGVHEGESMVSFGGPRQSRDCYSLSVAFYSTVWPSVPERSHALHTAACYSSV